MDRRTCNWCRYRYRNIRRSNGNDMPCMRDKTHKLVDRTLHGKVHSIYLSNIQINIQLFNFTFVCLNISASLKWCSPVSHACEHSLTVSGPVCLSAPVSISISSAHIDSKDYQKIENWIGLSMDNQNKLCIHWFNGNCNAKHFCTFAFASVFNSSIQTKTKKKRIESQ